MIIKNLTSKALEIKVKDIVTRDEYPVILYPNRPTNRNGVVVLEIEKLKGIIEITEESTNSVAKPIVVEEDISAVVEIEEATELTEKKEIPTETETLDDRFICEECGAEFGSSRGLTSHMSRVHSK